MGEEKGDTGHLNGKKRKKATSHKETEGEDRRYGEEEMGEEGQGEEEKVERQGGREKSKTNRTK